MYHWLTCGFAEFAAAAPQVVLCCGANVFLNVSLINICQQSSWKRPPMCRPRFAVAWPDAAEIYRAARVCCDHAIALEKISLKWRKSKEKGTDFACKLQTASWKAMIQHDTHRKTRHPAWSDQWPVHQIVFPPFSSKEIGQEMFLSMTVHVAQSAKGMKVIMLCSKIEHDWSQCFAPQTSKAFPENIRSTS